MKKTVLLILSCMLTFSSMATMTRVVVRAKAKDAKFIGSSMGGAHIIVRNAITNEILAQGKTTGTTGNTMLIMKTDLKRGMAITDDRTARFQANIDLKEPVFVQIEAHGPMNRKQATAMASTQLWLIPGKHILGDGIILEIPGFVVDILSPRTHRFIPLDEVKNAPLKIQANIVMMCGCSISKGGTWDSDEIDVKAMVKKEGQSFSELPMALDSVNLFEGSLSVTEPGTYEVLVYAYHARSGNTGVDRVTYIISE